MTIHISARMAWHMDGWNGRVCKDPAANRYCIGPHSYPGDNIRERRDLEWEQKVAGKCCSGLDRLPPCIASINAFGADKMQAEDAPPKFFKTGNPTRWELPPATVCVWPYEEMYRDDVKSNGKIDHFARMEFAKQYFSEIEEKKSLVFHYANYSNPFSEEDAKRYVLIGLARIKKLGDFHFYKGTDQATKEQFGGAYIWQRNVETLYPDQGLRLPYHRYLDDGETLEQILLVPDNPRCFKYGSRHVSDDEALSLVERFIEVIGRLIALGDTSEDWQQRLAWLNSLLAELWESRGLYPGLSHILGLLGLAQAITPFKQAVLAGDEREYRDAVFDWLEKKRNDLPGLDLSKKEAESVRRQWKLREDDERILLTESLPRFDIPKDQLELILSAKRDTNGIHASLADIVENPYTLSEQFIGNDPDDSIPFSRIDHGVLPSPDLGGENIHEPDDWRRLRALLVDRLKFETKHTFLSSGLLLQDINHRLSHLPDWKRKEFTARYLEVDREPLEQALVFREEGEREYLYLRFVHEDERQIEATIRELAGLKDIKLKSPMTTKHWRDLLFDANSPLAEKCRKDYDEAIDSQAETCSTIFTRPVSVVCGAAGTGKTTIIKSILKAIDKTQGTATFLLLAPTGKAADRIREKTGKEAKTIHSFLAQKGWLNDNNMTLRRAGGGREDKYTTYVIDEASMLNLELLAALFRAINWGSVQRLIIVGDPNQLPPIGRGRVFADIIAWLRSHHTESVGELTVNLRQMENRVLDRGNGILDLASLYVRPLSQEQKEEEPSLRAEEIFQRVQDLPEDGSFDKDLRLLFWEDAADLLDKLVQRIVADMEQDSGLTFDPEKPQELWLQTTKCGGKGFRPEYFQVISPYIHEEFGTEAINLRIQQEARGKAIARIGALAGITLHDKVIQVRNRGVSDSLWAYNFNTKNNEPCQVYNGELGYVMAHGFDKSKTTWSGFYLKRFSVKFSRKDHLAVGYGKELGTYEDQRGRKRWIREEKPEDNLQLAYAISVHKSQGSEFDRVYFVLPKEKAALLSPELFYTGITRATKHCTIFIQKDVEPLLLIHRPEASHLVGINCSLFDFTPAPEGFEALRRKGFREEGKYHRALADIMMRSKSEVIIANMLFDREIPFLYEEPLYAKDGSFYLPDFTITWRGEQYFWEHLGLLHREEYRQKWETKKKWYDKHFPGQLLVTEESGDLSKDALAIISETFA